jgi:hypothetical protein
MGSELKIDETWGFFSPAGDDENQQNGFDKHTLRPRPCDDLLPRETSIEDVVNPHSQQSK